MKIINCCLKIIIVLANLISVTCFAEQNSQNLQYVDQLYPNLAASVLTYAKVCPLPENILLKAEGLEINSKDIDGIISQQPIQIQVELKKNAFFVLEQEATSKLMLKMAKQELGKQYPNISLMSDNQVRNIFFGHLTKDIAVTDQDIETFYKENESVFCNTPLNSVRKQIQSYVLQDKKQRFVDKYVQSLGQKVEILVSDTWTRQQAESAKDNPLDKARANGKVTLAVFSAASCCGPDKMLPVIGTVRRKYNDRINIVYIELRKEQILAARYRIRSIPTQIFYDSKGRESFRHSGFYSENDILKKLDQLGVK